MSWIPVEFSLVRYSSIEGTHYFFDPIHPTAVQFLLNGHWESWDVGWVRSKALDPDIRRVAEEAEAQLLHNVGSEYRHWPRSPIEHEGPSAQGNGHGAPPNTNHTSHLPLPNPGHAESTASPAHTYAHHHSHNPHPTCPRTYGQRHQSHAIPYASPYQQVPTTALNSNQSPYTVPVSPPSETSSAAAIGGHLPAIGTSGTLAQPESQTRLIGPASDAPTSSKSQLPVPATRDTKVLLSLDGDGVRGLSTILLVESLVNAICTKMGRRADPYQIFDLIGGTSTGGILAIMLGRLRMRAHKAREAYAQVAKIMFMDKWNFFISLDPHAPRPQYKAEVLEKSMKEIITHEGQAADDLFFDQRTDSTNVFVISTQVDIGINRPALIRTYPTRRMAGPELDANLTTCQVMRATSVAPRYVDPQGAQTGRAVIEPGLVDYGTGKNNPIRDLVFECRKLYGYAHDTMVIVSIGTGSGLDRAQEISKMANSIDERVLEARMAGEKFEKDNESLIDRGWMKYFRFNVPNLEDVPLDESSHVERIKEKTRAYLGIPEVGQKFYDCVEVVTAIVLGEKTASRSVA